ncbi:hypothetical protein TREMEDRAFT_45569 [Tremella mesenterica DSM 1558]|uniref:uncharacterized protein n=1 Tax=Tremella mesenterica (strain ATCC 24925 / CBS 8224 / DSM 1558 / NBRC 9311 / NRRL Y-6157 / RJB 2259-6 / UBC 559-6) TaxID=578456 RepID=UPI00032D3374|nr:uncharacterized protein TREMEDRAFT_45569 [Tremella mesenterica DSM 1558]EIW66718.1 hypothetical protein TREMEDRAFT_45569 [Tremella mesenterica DSM 1558]
MFKKNQSNPSQPYAFSQPTAVKSSVQARKQENETFYKPLPPPINQTSNPNLNTNTNNPYVQNSDRGQRIDPFSDQYRTRTPSPQPNASRPLLEASPDMARQYPQNRLPGSGSSQSALLGERQPAARRYGPTAASVPAGPNAALLGNSSGSSVGDKAVPGQSNAFAGQDVGGWNASIDGLNPEADDYLHNPDPKRDRTNDRGGSIFTTRGLANIGCLLFLLLCLITLFAGYPIISHYTQTTLKTNGAYNLGGINSTGQVPQISNFPTVIDPDTPTDAYTITGFDGETYQLVFSDEFEKDGRTFYEGDDPYWTAVDIHYWPTGDFEWYDPSAVTTSGGNLVITMTQEPIHQLNFKSGMVQSWNQMCFQYSAHYEVKVSLPGTPRIGGFWPGAWMMGNLGRPGYGATTEGTWPYTYDSCDSGTLKNQTNAAGTGPAGALEGNDDTGISFLPGQRMSSCTCPGEDHAGPDVSYGRGVPEIDALEAQTDLSIPMGQLSQSAQVAPFDMDYQYTNTTDVCIPVDTTKTKFNSYQGGVYQEAVSMLTYIDAASYQLEQGQFAKHGFEMYSDPNDRQAGYITWFADDKKTWTMKPGAVPPRPEMDIGQRLITEEPMAMVLNFGMSNNFQTVNFAELEWPAHMLIDYVRVYQRPNGKIGCDPDDRPTSDYINNHLNAYSNANLTTWEQAGYGMPKNRLVDTC